MPHVEDVGIDESSWNIRVGLQPNPKGGSQSVPLTKMRMSFKVHPKFASINIIQLKGLLEFSK